MRTELRGAAHGLAGNPIRHNRGLETLHGRLSRIDRRVQCETVRCGAGGATRTDQCAQLEGGTSGSRAMVLDADGNAEHQDDPFLAELVDRAAVPLHDLPRVALQTPSQLV